MQSESVSTFVLLTPPERSPRSLHYECLGRRTIFSYNLIYSLDGPQGASTADRQSLRLISGTQPAQQLPLDG